ncbi:MAG: SHOCT domain-containing protein [Ferruginibacter sp.]
MKKLLFALLLTPLLSSAQKPLPRFEDDTLYTTSGFKIYIGMLLQIGKGTGDDGKFRFINIKNGVTRTSLTGNTILIRELKNFGISSLGNAYIEIIGSITFKDSSKGRVDLHVAFDRAIENSLEQTSELVVPQEFRSNSRIILADKLDKLAKRYKEGSITKAELDAELKKLLDQ